MAQAGLGADKATEPGELERITHRINNGAEQLGHLASRLERLNDRILGCIPREVERKESKPDDQPSRGLDSIHTALERLTALSDILEAELTRLEGL